jgi:hypothetical protein
VAVFATGPCASLILVSNSRGKRATPLRSSSGRSVRAPGRAARSKAALEWTAEADAGVQVEPGCRCWGFRRLS